MRQRNTMINFIVGMVVYMVITVTTFITPAVIANNLGDNISKLSNALLAATSILGIIELGIGTGIVYKLYEPIAKKDNEKIAVILLFYKKAYKIIASVVFCAGLIYAFLFPYINGTLLAKFPSDSGTWMSVMFMICVCDVLATYLFAHKRSMIIADQRNYIINIAHCLAAVLACVVQVIIAKVFRSFELFLIAKVASTLFESLFVHFMYKKRYSYINLKTKSRLDKAEKDSFMKSIKALFMHRIGGASISIIPKNIINAVIPDIGRNYGFYTLVTEGLIRVINQIFSAIVASFGNVLVTESKDTAFDRFKSLYLLNHLVQSFFCVGFYTCISQFIIIYPTKEVKWFISSTAVILLLIYFYIMGMRESILMVKVSAGIYREDRFFAIGEAASNILLSLILVRPFGLEGVLFANIITTIMIPIWTQPYLVYKIVFNKSLKHYYKMLFVYASLTATYVVITHFVCQWVHIRNVYVDFFFRMLMSAIIPNVLNVIIFWKKSEFQYIKNAVFGVLGKFFRKKKAEIV